MKICRILDESISIGCNMANAVVSFAEMTVSAVAIVTDVVRDGAAVTGYGFNSNGRYSQSGILRTRLIPRLLAANNGQLLDDAGSNFDPFKCWQVMMRNEKPGGHGDRAAAVGALDMALWDAVAKIEGKPLYRLLADRFRGGVADGDVYVYAAGGYYYPQEAGVALLQDEMRRYVDMGYESVKMKVGGASLPEDLRRIEGVLAVLPKEASLAVDANGRFNLPQALDFSRAIEPYHLKWYEEPGDPLDYALLKSVAENSKTPLATGENLFSSQDARNLLRYGGLDRNTSVLQMDPALSYGLVDYLRTLEVMKESNWSHRRCIPHGGHQLALHVAAGMGLGGNESYPGVFQPFGGFADGAEIRNGRMRIPDEPGVGIELKSNLFALFKQMLS